MAEFLFKNWAEFFFFILLVIGFLVALLSPSAVISYMTIFICGMIAGRMLYERKSKGLFPYYLIIIGFFIGFMLGAYHGDREVMLVLFVLGALISYFVYNKGIIRDLRY